MLRPPLTVCAETNWEERSLETHNQKGALGQDTILISSPITANMVPWILGMPGTFLLYPSLISRFPSSMISLCWMQCEAVVLNLGVMTTLTEFI